MTECSGLKSPAPAPRKDGAAAGCSRSPPASPEFMTQALRRTAKRTPGEAGTVEERDREATPARKRLRLADDNDGSAAANVAEEGPTSMHFDAPREADDLPSTIPPAAGARQDPAEDAAGEGEGEGAGVAASAGAAARADGHAGDDDADAAGTNGGGQGSKSVLQTVFSPLFSVLRVHGQPDGLEAERDRNGAAVVHGTAHHPPVPEVPEAAESEYDEDEDENVDFDPLLFIKTLPPLEQCIPEHRPMLLPRKTRQCKKKTLVLDLDETLVHSSLEHTASSDFSFQVHFNNLEHVIHVKQRPHLHEFMASVADMFEVVVFTASQRVYAEKLLNVIDPKRTLIKHRIYRESCVVVDGNYLKDLTVLGRDLSSTFIVDNSPQAFGFQPSNGIPIESWYDDEQDTELLKLLPFLHSLADVDDVRPHIANKFRLVELIQKTPMPER